MLELVYPVETVALVMSGAKASSASEMLPIIEPEGLVIGQASREVCHGGSMLLHPVVHLHIVDRQGNIYLQRRSANKRLLPLYWDTAVGGHVSYGEMMEESLFREAAEELGFYDFNPQGICSYIWESEREREMVCVYAAVGNFELNPDNYEVQEGKYWSVAEIDEAVGKNILTPNFEYEYAMVKDKLLALL